MTTGTDPARASLLIVESVTRKRAAAGPAKDVYDSRLWAARRRYAEQSGMPWLILSSRHGLLDPEEPIAPYELRLGDLGEEDREAVAQGVVEQLSSLRPLDGLVVEAHVRAAYADRLAAALAAAGGRLDQPLRGLSTCGQLGWYRGEQPAAAGALAGQRAAAPST